MSTTVLCCRPHLLLFPPTTLWTGYPSSPRHHHHCYRALLKMRKVTWLNSHLYNLELSPASPDTEEVSSTLCSDKDMATHLVGGSEYESSSTEYSKNILVAVMFTLYHHEFIDRFEKRTEASRKQPSVELSAGEPECQHILPKRHLGLDSNDINDSESLSTLHPFSSHLLT